MTFHLASRDGASLSNLALLGTTSVCFMKMEDGARGGATELLCRYLPSKRMKLMHYFSLQNGERLNIQHISRKISESSLEM